MGEHVPQNHSSMLALARDAQRKATQVLAGRLGAETPNFTTLDMKRKNLMNLTHFFVTPHFRPLIASPINFSLLCLITIHAPFIGSNSLMYSGYAKTIAVT